MKLEDRIKVFLVDWVDKKTIPHVRPGMVDSLSQFINSLFAEEEIKKVVSSAMSNLEKKEQREPSSDE